MVYSDLKVSDDILTALCILEGTACDVDRYKGGTLPRVQEKRLVLDGYRLESNIEGELLLNSSYRLAEAMHVKYHECIDNEEAHCDKIYEELRSSGLVDIFKKAYSINRVSAKYLVHKYEKVGVDNGLKIVRDGSDFYRNIGKNLVRIPNEPDIIEKLEKEVAEWKA